MFTMPEQSLLKTAVIFPSAYTKTCQRITFSKVIWLYGLVSKENWLRACVANLQ